MACIHEILEVHNAQFGIAVLFEGEIYIYIYIFANLFAGATQNVKQFGCV